MKRLHVARQNHWTQDKAQQELLITLNYNLFSVINSIMISSVSYLDRLKLEFCYASHMKSLTFGLALNVSYILSLIYIYFISNTIWERIIEIVIVVLYIPSLLESAW